MKPFIPTRFAEIAFALIIGFFGINHFIYADTMQLLVPDFMPGDNKIWVYVTGTSFVLAAIAIFINKIKRLAGYLLALLLFIITITIQLMGLLNTTEVAVKAMFMTNLFKDLAMALCAIMIGNNTHK
jgi:uncharacterized membrane protein